MLPFGKWEQTIKLFCFPAAYLHHLLRFMQKLHSLLLMCKKKTTTLVYLTAFYLQAIVFVCFCSLISDKTLYLCLTERLDLSVFICILSLCCAVVYLWKHGNQRKQISRRNRASLGKPSFHLLLLGCGFEKMALFACYLMWSLCQYEDIQMQLCKLACGSRWRHSSSEPKHKWHGFSWVPLLVDTSGNNVVFSFKKKKTQMRINSMITTKATEITKSFFICSWKKNSPSLGRFL